LTAQFHFHHISPGVPVAHETLAHLGGHAAKPLADTCSDTLACRRMMHASNNVVLRRVASDVRDDVGFRKGALERYWVGGERERDGIANDYYVK
jgi:hypothetical protein